MKVVARKTSLTRFSRLASSPVKQRHLPRQAGRGHHGPPPPLPPPLPHLLHRPVVPLPALHMSHLHSPLLRGPVTATPRPPAEPPPSLVTRGRRTWCRVPRSPKLKAGTGAWFMKVWKRFERWSLEKGGVGGSASFLCVLCPGTRASSSGLDAPAVEGG